MQENPVKRKLSTGDYSLGTFVFEFNSTGIARIAAAAGAEFIVFDMEHTGWSVESIRMLMATTPDGTVPIVRVPVTEYHFIARIFDMGAMGVMVPMVETAEQAELIVRSSKYPPAGRRGAAFGVAHDDYQGGDIVEKMNSANSQQQLIAQIETATGVENVDAIAAVPGIDVLWIGHFDLSNSLGIPAQFDHPQFKSAVSRVLEAAHKHGKIGGFMAEGVDNATALIKQGFQMIAFGGDLWIYQKALAGGLSAVREQAQ
ncbi:2-keto-3-deoxy-L-rhamnonate aldolase [Symmachiella dynata]|uniref:HpcH/HpaI aldolase family protein n=1 Tax=Symmachiella dynata TaxID=2527995 RepID=UPI001188F019|nr:aldolase/citrate lyase family protein [Symmachiella dynata]QDT46033.1 2-keto-3-deoxy-L-rhamnonate aldolase [Symmachiella dynata]